MSELIVTVFDDEHRAEEVRLDLLKMKHEHLVDLQDAVVLVREGKGKVKLHHMTHLTIGGAMSGDFLGTLLGLMLLNPVFALFGLTAGTVIGALTGSMKHLGIDQEFIKDFAEHLRSGASALCIQVKTVSPDKVLEELKKFEGKVLQTSLLHEDEEKLKTAAEAVREECIKLGYCEAA